MLGKNSKLSKVRDAHNEKLHNLGLEDRHKCNEAENVIFSYSSYESSDLENGNNMAPFELFLLWNTETAHCRPWTRNSLNRDLKGSLLVLIIIIFALSLISEKKKFLTLKGLSSIKDIILQKADKGKSVVLVNKADYTKRMKELSLDVKKFKEITIELGKEINLLLHHEGKSIEFIKQVKSSVTTDLYKLLYPQGSQPGITYGPTKIYKPLANGFPKLRPILSAINTGT